MSTRRAILRGLGALPIAATLPFSAAAQTTGLADLWHERLLACGELRAASLREEAAEVRLPWWVQPGPRFVQADGTFCGELSFSPAMQNYTIPDHPSIKHLIRPDEATIRARFAPRTVWGSNPKATEYLAQQLADLAELRIAADLERERVGLPALWQHSEAVCDRIIQAGGAILDLPVRSPDVLAAQVLVQLYEEARRDANADTCPTTRLAVFVLRALLPALSGELADDAAELVNHPEREVQALRLSAGIAPQGRLS